MLYRDINIEAIAILSQYLPSGILAWSDIAI
jgi:hypothetical protein